MFFREWGEREVYFTLIHIAADVEWLSLLRESQGEEEDERTKGEGGEEGEGERGDDGDWWDEVEVRRCVGEKSYSCFKFCLQQATAPYGLGMLTESGEEDEEMSHYAEGVQ